MWLKPHCVVVIAIVELQFFLARGRWRTWLRPEVLALVAASVLYLAHFFVVPTIRSEFIGRWLPLGASRYAAYNWPWAHVLSLKSLYFCVGLVLVMLMPWREPHRAIMRRIYPVAGFSIGSCIAMIAQHKGWPYHIIPMVAAGWMFVMLVAVQLMQQQSSQQGDGLLARVQRRVVSVRPQLLSTLILAWAATLISSATLPFRDYRSRTLDFVREHTQPSDAVTYMSTSVQLIYPEMLHTRRAAGSRFLWTFPIPYLFEGRGDTAIDPQQRYVPPAGREQEEALLASELIADLDARKPKVVFVYKLNGCQGCPKAFSMLRYLVANGFMAHLEDHYREQRSIDHWKVYLRRDVARAPSQD